MGSATYLCLLCLCLCLRAHLTAPLDPTHLHNAAVSVRISDGRLAPVIRKAQAQREVLTTGLRLRGGNASSTSRGPETPTCLPRGTISRVARRIWELVSGPVLFCAPWPILPALTHYPHARRTHARTHARMRAHMHWQKHAHMHPRAYCNLPHGQRGCSMNFLSNPPTRLPDVRSDRRLRFIARCALHPVRSHRVLAEAATTPLALSSWRTVTR
jgi:hypothetical protein